MTDKNLEFRASSWAAEDNEKISGYAVVFNQDTVLYKDEASGYEVHEIIDRHALDQADLSDVLLKYNHTGRVLARTRNKTLRLTIDDHGLKIEADMSSDEAKSYYRDVKSGLLDKMSFAFIVAGDGDEWDTTTKTRRITKISRLYDVSIVDFPAYPTTEVYARAIQFAEPEIRAARMAKIDKAIKAADKILDRVGILDEGPEMFDEDSPNERERILYKMAEIRASVSNRKVADDVALVEDKLNALQDLYTDLRTYAKRQEEMRQAIAAGGGTVIESYSERILGEHNMINEKDNALAKMLEVRSAAGTSGMGNVIPTEIVGNHLREGSNGLFDDVSYTTIAHAGDIRLPYIADSDLTVNSHTENNSITPAGNQPSVVTISHAEYECTLGFSFLGKTLAIDQFERIMNDALFSAMRAKLDSVAVAAVNALTWVKAAGATKNAVQWAASGAPTLPEILTLAKLLPERYAKNARFYMNRATSLAIIENSTGLISSTGSNGMFNIDVISGMTKLLGIPVVIDSNVAAGDILYGCGPAVHLNVAGDLVFNNWLDHDSLTEKMQVACAAGAGCETGAFVKGSNSIS